VNSKYPIVALFLATWRYARGHRHLLVISLLMFVVAQAFSLAEPYIIGKLLNTIQSEMDSADFLQSVLFYLGLFVAVQIGFWAFHGPGRVIERYLSFYVRTNFRQESFKIVTRLPVRWHKDTQSGDTIDKINRAANSLYEFSGQNFELVYMVGRLLGSIIILLFFMPQAGAIVLIISIGAFFIINRFDKVLYALYKQINKLENRVAAAIHDYVTNVVTVITLRLEERVQSEVIRRMLAPFNTMKKSFAVNEVKWFVTNMIIALMISAILWWYLVREIEMGHTLMAGTFFTLFEYLRRIGDSFYNFAWKYGTIVQQAANVNNVTPIFDAFAECPKEDPSDVLSDDWSELDIQGFHFTYEDDEHRKHHLENISVKLPRAGAIALVGESGSGKSTFLSLLRGLHTPESGVVICDGASLIDGMAHLAHHTTLLPQDPEIFADTILFNITFGVDAEEERVLDAVRLACFGNVLRRLPRGLMTNMSEKGVNLSGGEKQRLALARGIFFAADSDILLLDEPTSSVDVNNERTIYRNLLSHFSDKCLLSAVHKLHLLELFEYIYVFDEGKIVEEGSFEKLLEDKGVLARMWQEYQRESSLK